MEAVFSANSSLLTTSLIASPSNDTLYTFKTSFSSFRGPKVTLIADANPVPGTSSNVGAIHWQSKAIEIYGVRKGIDECRRRVGGFLHRKQYWKWSGTNEPDQPERREYQLLFEKEQWKAQLSDLYTVAVFRVPEPPILFHRSQPGSLSIDKIALEQDEVFILLVFLYLEVKRQKKANIPSPS